MLKYLDGSPYAIISLLRDTGLQISRLNKFQQFQTLLKLRMVVFQVLTAFREYQGRLYTKVPQLMQQYCL